MDNGQFRRAPRNCFSTNDPVRSAPSPRLPRRGAERKQANTNVSLRAGFSSTTGQNDNQGCDFTKEFENWNVLFRYRGDKKNKKAVDGRQSSVDSRKARATRDNGRTPTVREGAGSNGKWIMKEQKLPSRSQRDASPSPNLSQRERRRSYRFPNSDPCSSA